MTTETNRPLTPRERAEAQYRKDRARVVHAMRRVLEDDTASPGLTVFAAETLDHILGVGLVPGSAKRAIDGEAVNLSVFKEAVDALTTADNQD